jgi:hypothetical protein
LFDEEVVEEEEVEFARRGDGSEESEERPEKQIQRIIQKLAINNSIDDSSS